MADHCLVQLAFYRLLKGVGRIVAFVGMSVSCGSEGGKNFNSCHLRLCVQPM